MTLRGKGRAIRGVQIVTSQEGTPQGERAARCAADEVAAAASDCEADVLANRYMEVVPAGGAGASVAAVRRTGQRSAPTLLVDPGRRGRYRSAGMQAGPASTMAKVLSIQRDGEPEGLRATLVLPASAPALVVCFELSEDLPGLVVPLAVPDEGSLSTDERWRLARAEGEPTMWLDRLPSASPAHVIVPLLAAGGHFHVLIGCGDFDVDQRDRLLELGMMALHNAPSTSPVVPWDATWIV